MIQIKNISKSFGNLKVLNNVSFTVKKGETILIQGPNGSGKTTLLRCIAMLEDIDSGEIIINNTKITPNSKYLKKQIIGFVFQELHPWNHLTVLENLTKPLKVIKKLDKSTAIKKAEEMLDLVGLSEKKNTHPYYLSGGQKRRLIIARTLIMDPEIILLDEITANLDIELKKEIYKIIRKISKDKTLIIVSHDKEIKKFVDKIIKI